MKNDAAEESIKFNLIDQLEFSSNAIVVRNIKVANTCTIQAFAFDFGKVLTLKNSPDVKFIHIIEGKAEVVIHNNSTFMHSGDSILIPVYTSCSIEANEKFKMICTIIKSDCVK